jgi:hypothetical protein
LFDPQTKQAFEYTADGVRKIVDALRTESPAIEIPLSEIFSE